MKEKPYFKKQLHELLYQSLETERGGIKIYEAAPSCVQNKDLKGEVVCRDAVRLVPQEILPVFVIDPSRPKAMPVGMPRS